LDYKGIAYTIRAQPGANRWLWTIFPEGGLHIAGSVEGTRELAASRARQAIERCLERQAQAQSVKAEQPASNEGPPTA
jgi:hypothetical protein